MSARRRLVRRQEQIGRDAEQAAQAITRRLTAAQRLGASIVSSLAVGGRAHVSAADAQQARVDIDAFAARAGLVAQRVPGGWSLRRP